MTNASQITRRHLEGLAAIYVRQSTLAQVRDNTESTSRQYGLAELAVTLGWDGSRVLVIDGDLGMSGRSAALRPGYKELVSRVCLGEVGAIFGLEVSRLARSSADFQRLLEFCNLTDTLIIDADGVYDLRNFNDRLLLGLKGTMSEAELHILAGRLQESKKAAARRGELRFPVPVGYVHDEDEQILMDPNEEVRAAISDVFKTFAVIGSACGVVRAFSGRPFPQRAYGGAWGGELRWGRLTHGRVQDLLTNPSYAGAYVFGRFRSQRWLDAEGTIRSRTVELPREEWTVLIHDHHPAYISWETHLDIKQRLAANCTNRGARPPREGSALLQGIVLCGACGHMMTTRYASRRAYYDCSVSRSNHTQRPGCRSISATAIDAAVSRRLLEVVSADQIALALAAADEVTGRRARASRALELQVERARYEAHRAERAFHACEPENRLVARSLEQRWEAKLGTLAEAEAAVAVSRAEVAPLPSRQELEALANDLPRLWNSPSNSAKDRKRLLRTLIANVTIMSQPAPHDEVRLGVQWGSGAAEEFVILRPGVSHSGTPAAVIELVKQLVGHSDEDIARELNDAELRTGLGRPFDATAVRWVRHAHRIPSAHDDKTPGELTIPEVAARLGVRQGVIHRWVHGGRLATRRTASGRHRIAFSSVIEQYCREMIQHSPRIESPTPTSLAGGAV